MVTQIDQARVFSGDQSLSNINIFLVDEGTLSTPNPLGVDNILPSILLLLLEEQKASSAP